MGSSLVALLPYIHLIHPHNSKYAPLCPTGAAYLNYALFSSKEKRFLALKAAHEAEFAIREQRMWQGIAIDAMVSVFAIRE